MLPAVRLSAIPAQTTRRWPTKDVDSWCRSMSKMPIMLNHQSLITDMVRHHCRPPHHYHHDVDHVYHVYLVYHGCHLHHHHLDQNHLGSAPCSVCPTTRKTAQPALQENQPPRDENAGAGAWEVMRVAKDKDRQGEIGVDWRILWGASC